MKARGSAIIIAMLLITAVGGVAFGISRVLFVEFAAASYYVNGAVAYYAAESGMEEGFLRYRYNRNAEVPFTSWGLNENYVYRSNLSDKNLISTNDSYNPTTAVTDSNKQYYDLRMGYLGTFGGPFYGQDLDNSGRLMDSSFSYALDYATGDYSFLKIPKDESLKIDLTGLDLSGTGTDLDFGLKYLSGTSGEFTNVTNGNDNKCRALAEVKFVIQYGSGVTKEYKEMLSYANATAQEDYCERVLGVGNNALFKSSSNSTSEPTTSDYYNKTLYVEVNRLQDMIDLKGGTLPESSNNDKVTLYVKPLYYDAAIALTIDQCDVDLNNCTDKTKVVAGPFTTISTTGYYGGTSRKLEANIDRQSGTLYDLFDYVIYKNS